MSTPNVRSGRYLGGYWTLAQIILIGLVVGRAGAGAIKDRDDLASAHPLKDRDDLPSAHPLKDRDDLPRAHPLKDRDDLPSRNVLKDRDDLPSGHVSEELQDFLQGGPKLWAKTQPPKIPAGISIMTASGHLKDNSFVDFLLFAREHNPTRFDRHHPRIAPLLAEAQTLSTTSLVPAPPVTIPAGMTHQLKASSRHVSDVAEAQVLAAPVPEPSSVLSALFAVGAFAFWRRNSGRSRSRMPRE